MTIRNKILYVLGGVPHYTAPLLERIVAKGFNITMLIPEQKDDKVIGDGVKLMDHHASYHVRVGQVEKAWYAKSAFCDLRNIIQEEQPDILMIGWPYFLQLFFERSILKVMKQLNVKLILREIPFQVPPFGKFLYFRKHPIYNENMELQSRGLLFYVRIVLIMFVRRFLYRRADASLNYASVANEIIPTYGIQKEAVFVSYNTSDTDALFHQLEAVKNSVAILESKRRVLHIGRLVKWKRVDLLIDAFHQVLLNFPDSELMIIGNGPERAALEVQAASLGIAQKVVFTGAIYDPFLLGKYMYESSVYVLAGTGGLSINDAMCFGMPVICAVCDGTERDLVEHGVNGYFFREGDANDLALKIQDIFASPQQSVSMGEASFKVIQNKINLETVANRYIEAFRYVLNK
ncbi:MAG: glycosyltransferase [Prolixibacteraceae bacterium]|nr:glycosyltransferase [Prolixibacteraceae bacterium]